MSGEAIRQRMRDRERLAPTIESLLNGTHISPVSEDELEEMTSTGIPQYQTPNHRSPLEKHRTFRFREAYRKLKLERNAYVAIFLPKMWESFRPVRDSLRIEKLSPMDLLEKLDTAFSLAIYSWERQVSDLSPREARMYRRFEKIVTLGVVSNMKNAESPGDFIAGGVRTSTKVAVRLALFTKDQLRRKGITSKDAFVRSLGQALRSIPIQFAMLDLEIAMPMLSASEDKKTGFQEEFFNVSLGNDGTISITPNWERFAKVKFGTSRRKVQVLKRSLDHPTTGCPAALAKTTGNSSVLREHLLWMYDVLSKHM